MIVRLVVTMINILFFPYLLVLQRVEEQMNDLIELHQNEIENLKQGIADMEEKIQYQSEERLRDVYEMLDSCQTRVSVSFVGWSSCILNEFPNYFSPLFLCLSSSLDLTNGTSTAPTSAATCESRFS